MPRRQAVPVNPGATPRPKRTRKTLRPTSPPTQDLWSTPEDDKSEIQQAIPPGGADKLWKSLRAVLPKGPEPHKFGPGAFSVSSRKASQDDFHLRPSKRLDKVVPLLGMISRLLPKLKELLDACPELPDDHPLWSRLDVSNRCAHLPNSVCTEHDSEDWIHSAILRPAVAVIHYLTKHRVEDHGFPNVSSVGGRKPIPDSLFFESERSLASGLIAMEFKTRDVLMSGWVRSVTTLFRLQGDKGWAAKFHWPQGGQKLTKTTNIFTQIWGQMESWRVKFMLLSSYDHTYLLARPNNHSTTLYVSRQYTPGDGELLPATIAFMALALGKITERDLDLPDATTEHWPRSVSTGIAREAGLDEKSFVKPKKK